MIYFGLGSLPPTVLCFLIVRVLWKLLQTEQQTNREREKEWIVERERLLNRSMTRTWQDYRETSASMVVHDNGPRPVGLSSDEEEMRRAGLGADVDFERLHELTGTSPNELYVGEPTIGADD
jgi:hypothetical protein